MLLENLRDKKVVLASKSPRRQELLKGLELDFEIRTKDIDESYPSEIKGKDIAVYLSKLKSEEMRSELNPNEILITSDTIVLLQDEVLEKPQSKEEATIMLQKLSDNKHTVVTAVTIFSHDFESTFFDQTEVYFNQLNEKEIEHYIDGYKPFDKAGSYGVQELMGYIGIKRLEGCYYNVMGLPLQRLYNELKKI